MSSGLTATAETLADFAVTLMMVSWFAVWFIGLVYMIWAFARSGAGESKYSAQSRVRFEAIWGMVLAWPAVYLGMGSAFAGSTPWWWPGVVAGVVALYVVAGLALAGRTLPWWARFYPLAVAALATPLVSFVSLDGAYWFSFLLFSRLGIGYAAEVMVGVRFALAVGRRQALDAPGRDRARQQPGLSGAP